MPETMDERTFNNRPPPPRFGFQFYQLSIRHFWITFVIERLRSPPAGHFASGAQKQHDRAGGRRLHLSQNSRNVDRLSRKVNHCIGLKSSTAKSEFNFTHR